MNVLAITFLGINVLLFGLDLLAFFALYVAISLSLNLEYGFAGVPNFGKVLFVAAGASVGGAFAGRLAAWLLNVGTQGSFINLNFLIIPQVNTELAGNIPLSFGILVLSLVVAAGVGVAFGFLFSYPAIRLREDYLAMTLLAMAQFFQIFLNNYYPLIGGSLGLELPDPYAWAGHQRDVVATGVLVIFAALVYIYSEKIAHAPLARTLRAMRDNEAASEALGKNDVAIRRNTLMVASAISAMAGLLYSFYTVDVVPATFGRVEWTFWPWVIVIMGGAANNLGVTFGVLVFWVMVKFIDSGKFVFSNYIPFDVTWLEYLLIGTVLILILMVRPQGILPEKSTPTLPKSRIKKILDKYTSRKEATDGQPNPATTS